MKTTSLNPSLIGQRASVRSMAHRRKGAAFVLILAMLSIFVVVAAITIDFSYMQLVRAEMRAATDAAAKAGAECLARTENTVQAAQAAVDVASTNRVGGKPFNLRTTDIEFGHVSPTTSAKWEFVRDVLPYNAVRINSKSGANAANAEVPLYFSSVLGRASFAPSYVATAGQQEVDVCLCLDRSGSMLFDMSGNDYEYPPNNSNLSSFTAWGTVWQNHLSPPHPTQSRWAVLRDSIDLFLNEIGNYTPQPRTALVTWGSDYTMPISPFTAYSASSVNTPLPSNSGYNWSTNKTNIKNAVQALNSVPMMGGTNLSAGLDAAVAVLKGTNSSLYKNKVVILMTDGQWNAGRDPVLAAQDARSQGITVHCVSMLTSEQTVLDTIARTCGGKYIRTTNTSELRAAFIELANSLPVVLTD
ncbi:MAG: vWA domain-containing protein [Pirellula sp.]